ncbi:MAG: bifunctional precorrin-2 dehydrogenase/sirohydrochlorin ferrochelatase [Sulfurovum sp.]|nr:MAG: bifunctional precorrin-2 dehydrogenase/sirohydrochlorin ferrochelatase [Sulfurovum sp.]
MSFFPAYFNLKNKKILLVGGGHIALEKLEKLVEFTKNINIIAKEVSKNFETFAQKHTLSIEKRAYKLGDILPYDVVIVATNTVILHKIIYEESRTRRILVNSVDNTAYCDFIFPSYIKKGDLTISISTSGASPAMAKRLRIYIEKLIPSSIESFLKEMRGLRKTMPKGKERMKFFEEKSDNFMKKYFK